MVASIHRVARFDAKRSPNQVPKSQLSVKDVPLSDRDSLS